MADDPAPGGSSRAGAETRAATYLLKGPLPCVGCRYDLRGLSVLGVCPECGVPVKATLLWVVDPQAGELRPLFAPRLTALGLLVWAGAGLAACVVTWMIRAIDMAPRLGLGHWDTRGLVSLAFVLILASGAGAVALVRPHAGMHRMSCLLAAMSVVLYGWLAMFYAFLHGAADPDRPVPPYMGDPPSNIDRQLDRLLIQACMLVIVLGLRPNARTLEKRSHLLRTGRVDRQTLMAMAASLLVSAGGDGLVIWSVTARGVAADALYTGGSVLIAVGSLLFTLGAAGVCMDVARLARVLVGRAVSLGSLVRRADAGGDDPGTDPREDRG